MANAFACRSTTLPAWRLPILGNKVLIVAVIVELAITAGFMFIRPVAEVLGHESPPGVGWAIALASIPVLLVVDALHKTLRRARQRP
jgi:hypothetical protein